MPLWVCLALLSAVMIFIAIILDHAFHVDANPYFWSIAIMLFEVFVILAIVET